MQVAVAGPVGSFPAVQAAAAPPHHPSIPWCLASRVTPWCLCAPCDPCCSCALSLVWPRPFAVLCLDLLMNGEALQVMQTLAPRAACHLAPCHGLCHGADVGEPHLRLRYWNSWHFVADAWNDLPLRPGVAHPLPRRQLLAAAAAACRLRHQPRAAGPHPRGLCHYVARQRPASCCLHGQAASVLSRSGCGNGMKPPQRLSRGLQQLDLAVVQQHTARPPQQRCVRLGVDNWAVPGELHRPALTSWLPPLQPTLRLLAQWARQQRPTA